MKWPKLSDIDLANQSMTTGWYTLNLIQQYRPDIELIHMGRWRSYTDYDWLDKCIQIALAQGKIVCVCPWEEGPVVYPDPIELFNVLNKFENDPVYWITQYIVGTTNPKLRIKTVALYWWLLNDCMVYNAVKQFCVPNKNYNKNYLCMLGRFEEHKYQLGKQLKHHGLDQHGLITVAYPDQYPSDHVDFAQTCPVSLYPKLTHLNGKAYANTKIGAVWASGNVENYLKLEQEFADIPLIINPDTSCGILVMTEKLLWPILLGKLFLVYGCNGIMQGIQKFIDIDISQWANLEFDSIKGWTKEINQERLDSMITKNKNLIENSQDVYRSLRPQLEHARNTVTENFYRHFVSQLETIQ